MVRNLIKNIGSKLLELGLIKLVNLNDLELKLLGQSLSKLFKLNTMKLKLSLFNFNS